MLSKRTSIFPGLSLVTVHDLSWYSCLMSLYLTLQIGSCNAPSSNHFSSLYLLSERLILKLPVSQALHSLQASLGSLLLEFPSSLCMEDPAFPSLLIQQLLPALPCQGCLGCKVGYGESLLPPSFDSGSPSNSAVLLIIIPK